MQKTDFPYFLAIAASFCCTPLFAFTTTRFCPTCGNVRVVHVLKTKSLPFSSLGQTASQLVPDVTETSSYRNQRVQEKKRSRLCPKDRFDRTAPTTASAGTPIVMQIHGKLHNMTAWAHSHPGGYAVLKKFHNRDATKAFEVAGHSQKAYALLQEFVLESDNSTTKGSQIAQGKRVQVKGSEVSSQSSEMASVVTRKPSATSRNRIVSKLFTKEDPRGIHKTLGVFCLTHFLYRFSHMLFGDMSAGLGTRLGKGASVASIALVLPHAMLSLSSLIFHTVPRERVVGKPMIWQEFRAHNIIFGLRAVVCTVLAWISIRHNHAPAWRTLALLGSFAAVVLSNFAADQATHKLRVQAFESTTATMPYWEGCSIHTQRRFKTFYAYSQFMATVACLATTNPAWPFSTLLAIQLASLLMTLVRKGLISTRAYHITYTAALVMPYLVVLRDSFHMSHAECVTLFFGGWMLYQLRRSGLNKYKLWITVGFCRFLFGDRILTLKPW